jgi:hypothetical protein
MSKTDYQGGRMKKVLGLLIIVLFVMFNLAVAFPAEAPKEAKDKVTRRDITLPDKDGKALLTFVIIYGEDKKPTVFGILDESGQPVFSAQQKTPEAKKEIKDAGK